MSTSSFYDTVRLSRIANTSNGLHGQQVHTIKIPAQIREAGTATPEIIAEAVTYLHRDGVLILEDAIEPAHLDELDAMLGPEAEQIALDPDHHFNFGKHTRNMDQAPPLIPDLMFQDVWSNPIAVAICTAIFGPSPTCHYANGNTALKSTGRQPVHADIDKPHPLYPFAYAINIPLCDTRPENGSTELWLGSHRDSHIDQHVRSGPDNHEYENTIQPHLVAARRPHSPPVQPSTKKGSLIIRDLRLWHAGMPNRTDRPRVMLAFVVQPKWFQAPSKVLLPLKTKPLVERWKAETGLEFAARWVDGEVDHRKINSEEADFTSANKWLREMEGLMHLPPR